MVNKPTQQDVPAFYSPLTHDQHAQIGRISVLWGQCEMFVDNLLTHILGISSDLRLKLFGDRQLGTKLDTLSTFAKDMEVGSPREELLKFIRIANEVKGERNSCFHGVWGFHVTRRKGVIAGAKHHRQPEKPFKAADLPKLERKLCQLSHQGMIALSSLGQMNRFVGAYELFHGEPDLQWLAEWKERLRADRHAPGHKWKPGRLPYLDHPLE